MLNRQRAQASLIGFTSYTFPRYRPAAHHKVIAEQLERVERGEVDRLMLLVPPRHGKSELASRRFPAYYLGKHPERQFISASANSELAADFGRDVRNILASPEYGYLFPTRLAADSQAKGKWNTQQGGSYFSVGLDGAVLGRGAHVFLIDDPFGTMADARSESNRRYVYSWFSGTAYNRLQPGGAIVVINHRMHEDDLSGQLLAQQAAGGDTWEVVELKAIDDDGNALWEEDYPIDVLERIRRNTLAVDWSALYQQNPTPDEGTFFSRDWLRPYTEVPDRKTLQVYMASDYAVTDDGGDYTVHIVVGMDPEERLYVLDLWRGQTASDVWVDTLCDMVLRWKPLGLAEESGQIKAGVGPFLTKRMEERQAYVARTQFPTRGDKRVRAQSIRGRMAMKGLYVPVHAPWYPDLRAELLAFDAGKHDDMVDALGLIGQIIDRMIPGRLPVTVKPRPVLGVGVGASTATMNDLWAQRDIKGRRAGSRGRIG